MKFLLFLMMMFFISSIALAKPSINRVTVNADSIGLYKKFEITFDVAASFSNPYNHEEISVKAVFISPSSKSYKVDGFYYQNFTVYPPNGDLIANGFPNWKIRFAPTEVGSWTYVISANDINGSFTFPSMTFNCVPSANAGFIRKANNRYLKFDNGDPYFAIGENMGWYGSKTIFDYQEWM